MPLKSLFPRTAFFSQILGLALLPQVASAQQAATFTFEDQSPNIELEELTLKQKGLTVTITRPGTIFSVAVRSQFPPEWGTQALSPFLTSHADPYPFIFDLSKPASLVAIDAGDFGDDTDIISLFAYDGPGGTGNVVAVTRAYLPVPNFPFSYETLMVEGSAIRSFVVVGGSTYAPNSVFYDNLTVVLDSKSGRKGGPKK
jgi:hypothetical protein